MNIDQRVKTELEQEAVEIDRILANENSMSGMLKGGFRGGLGRWVLLINIVTLLVTVLLVLCGYRFFTGVSTEQQVFWGVLFVLTTQLQIALKQWLWQEMSRSSVIREMKRVELAVARLEEKLLTRAV